jgi:hypothetical protein
MKAITKAGHLFGKRSTVMKGFHVNLFFVAWFMLTLASAAFAQQTQEDGLSVVLNHDPTKKPGSTEFLTGQSKDFWDRLDLLNSGSGGERPEEGNRIRTFSLYPQSFSAVRPEALQTAPPRSYLLSLDDRGKENAYVGLANIDSEQRMDLKNIYQNNVNTELLLGYQWGSFGSILFGRALQFEREGETTGRLNDMGWRIKFMKTF